MSGIFPRWSDETALWQIQNRDVSELRARCALMYLKARLSGDSEEDANAHVRFVMEDEF